MLGNEILNQSINEVNYAQRRLVTVTICFIHVRVLCLAVSNHKP
jgi:hypothetical protein